MSAPEVSESAAAPPSRLRRVLRKLWWLHSTVALSFGVGVMLFARAGLAHAREIMIALFGSWVLMFIALRFIVGPANRRPDEALLRRGIRVATNYIIKQFYQQMFFFLVPIYASSATWSLASRNWWLPPILLVCGVVSTMDLVFDNFIMERRFLASVMYGLAMFGVLNVLMPLVAGVDHTTGLIIAAAATPASVALLSFRVRQVLSPHGALITVALTGALLAGVSYGKRFIPPAPLAMTESAVGHGTAGSYECLPASAHQIPATQLDGLRCGSLLREPGGLKEGVVHVWTKGGRELARLTPDRLTCDGDGIVFRSIFPPEKLPKDPDGLWACETYTQGGQLVGVKKFHVVGAPAAPHAPAAAAAPTAGSAAGSAAGSGAGSASGSAR